MKWLGLVSSLFALTVMSWLYYDWLTINGMAMWSAICFVGALTLFATVLFEMGVGLIINGNQLRENIWKKSTQEQKALRKQSSFVYSLALLFMLGCGILEIVNAMGVFGAQMALIQEANKASKPVATKVITNSIDTLQNRLKSVNAEISLFTDKITSEEKEIKRQLRSLYDDDKTRLESPEWQLWTTKKAVEEQALKTLQDAKQTLDAKLNSLMLQGIDSTQNEDKEQGVIKGTLFEWIASVGKWNAGVVQFVVMSIPALLLGLIGYGGLAIFLYWKTDKK